MGPSSGRTRVTKIGRVIVWSGLVVALLMGQCNLKPGEGAFLRVDGERCLGCGVCVKVCDADAIRIVNQKAVIDLTKCIECGKCVETCPVHAIQ